VPPGALWNHPLVFGSRSIKIANVFGIRIGVDQSWFIVLFLLIWLLSSDFALVFPGQPLVSVGAGVAAAVLFFLSVLLHELGHAAVAIRNGIAIAGIDLWLLGGVAKMSRDTDAPGVEFRVAIAGPLVSAALSAIFTAAVWAVTGVANFLNPLAVLQGPVAPAPVVAVLAYLAGINLLLLLFNLIPGFPLDGGRVVRAIAWKVTGDRLAATRLASGRGGAVALAFIGFGAGIAIATLQSGGVVEFIGLPFDTIGAVWLALIGLFLWQAARATRQQSELTERIHGLTVADVMDSQPVAVPLGLTLDRVLDEYLLRYRWPWFPVVDGDGRLAGLVTMESVNGVEEQRRASATVDEVMARDSEAMHTRVDESIESFLASGREGLYRLGAVMAVDAEGVLRGVITLQQVQRALRAG
jgi:Zn-dependent protease